MIANKLLPPGPGGGGGCTLMLAFILTVYLQNVGCVQSLANPAAAKHSLLEDAVISGNGIMSLGRDNGDYDASSQAGYWFAGSKRGVVKIFQWSYISESFVLNGETSDLTNYIPYPIYSLLWKEDSHQLFCGGGDRYVTVWKRKRKDIEVTGDDWVISQKLGPHTGWVKALAWDENNNLLHSIGCNCIETWRSSNDENDNRKWKHWKKRAIESSPDQGSTLSSDLLCMAIWQDYLFSGGVDGRIHVWSSNPMAGGAGNPLETLPAHKGRVNCLAVVPINETLCLLFSAGYDGTIQCRRCFRNPKKDDNDIGQGFLIETNTVATTTIVDGGEDRVTAVVCFRQANDIIQVLVGTSTGFIAELCFVESDTNWERCVVRENLRMLLEGEPAINAISTGPTSSHSQSPIYTIGHSNGLSILSQEAKPAI